MSQSELERVIYLPALIPVRTGGSFSVHWKHCATSHQKEASRPTGMHGWNPPVRNACLDTQEAFALMPGIETKSLITISLTLGYVASSL